MKMAKKAAAKTITQNGAKNGASKNGARYLADLKAKPTGLSAEQEKHLEKANRAMERAWELIARREPEA